MSKRFSRSEFLFFTAYVLWLLFAVLKLTYLKELIPYKTVNGYVEKAVFILLLLKLLDDDKYGLKGILGIAVVGILYYVSIQANAPGIMIPIYFVYSARNVDYKDVFKVTMVVQLTIMAVSVVCSLRGIIPNEIWDEETRARYSLGYTFCTYGSHISFFLTLIYMSIRKNIHFAEMVFLLAWNFIWYEVTDTRIDLLLCIPAVVGCYVLPKFHFQIKDNWFWRIALMAAGPVLAGVAIGGQWFYKAGHPLWERLNTMLNGRLYYGHEAIANYEFTFLGQYIKWIGRGSLKKHPDWIYNYVDCSYLKYLLHYGIFFFCLLMLTIIIVGGSIPKKSNIGLSIGFLLWLIYGMIDAELLDLSFQPFMLLLGSACTDLFHNERAKTQNKNMDNYVGVIGIRLKNDTVKWRL